MCKHVCFGLPTTPHHWGEGSGTRARGVWYPLSVMPDNEHHSDNRFPFTDEAMDQLMGLLGASPEMVFAAAPSQSGVPQLRADADGLFAGSIELVTTSGLDRTVKLVLLILAHSVLNVKFERKCNAFYAYVQKYMMGIDDGAQMPQKALKVRRQME